MINYCSKPHFVKAYENIIEVRLLVLGLLAASSPLELHSLGFRDNWNNVF